MASTLCRAASAMDINFVFLQVFFEKKTLSLQQFLENKVIHIEHKDCGKRI